MVQRKAFLNDLRNYWRNSLRQFCLQHRLVYDNNFILFRIFDCSFENLCSNTMIPFQSLEFYGNLSTFVLLMFSCESMASKVKIFKKIILKLIGAETHTSMLNGLFYAYLKCMRKCICVGVFVYNLSVVGQMPKLLLNKRSCN